MKIMAPSFKRSLAHTAALSAPDPAAGHRQPMTPQETEPDLPVSVQESPTEAGVGSGLLQGQGH